jgi:integration host factor subunit alpha
MTKAELAGRIRDKLELPLKDSVDLVETVLEIMKSTLEAGENLKIAGFGKYEVKKEA